MQRQEELEMAEYFASRSGEISQREKEHMNQVRELAGECMVILKNDGVLPLKETGKIALYGNGARRTVKGGTGSGDVYSRSVVSIEDGLEAAGFEIAGREWMDEYDRIRKEARAAYDEEVKCQAREKGVPEFSIEFGSPFREPDIPEIRTREEADLAVYVIARNSGEGADRFCRKGDYLLTDRELQALKFLGENYDRVVVILNVGNVIDLSQMMQIPGIDAVLLAGQAGNVGGYAVADVLTGKSIPSGKLTDTWAADYSDYPSSATFSHNNGNLNDEYYEEGIYVGYRYFDTFGVDPLYCFGYGSSYTQFQIETLAVTTDGTTVSVNVKVTNTGNEYPGKEVVQIYYSAPEGELEKPYQELAAFGKTKLLQPGESEEMTISWPVASMASYSERQAAWILETGTYYIRVGNSSRSTHVEAAVKVTERIVTEQLRNLFHDEDPVREWDRKNAVPYSYPEEEAEKAAAVRLTVDGSSMECRSVRYTDEVPGMTGGEGKEKLTADDVRSGRATLEALVSQLTVEEMAELCNGTASGGVAEGGEAVIGSSSAAVPGAAGDTTSLMLEDRNIRNIILADGPAGLRLMPHFEVTGDGKMIPRGSILGQVCEEENSGKTQEGSVEYYQYCTAIPIATTLAQSWNMDLIQTAGEIVGREMEEFHVTLWLAPGMNIHRNPLCGRNFEYYSEDPLLSGLCAAADTRGVQSHAGLGTTIKHYAANNQEDNRMYTNAHISERALREIYLKGFEIAVKTSQPMSIMTSYNLLNGEHTANHRDLLTAAAREEWGFAGLIMTDWGTTEDTRKIFGFGELKYTYSSPEGCIRAGNDLQMPGCRKNIDALIRAVREEKTLTEAELQQCAYRILKIVLESNAYEGSRPYTEQFGELPWMVQIKRQ